MNYFLQELLADIHFLVEGQVVAAHKLVLCQRCEVMMAMLTGGFKESTSDIVSEENLSNNVIFVIATAFF